MNEWAKPMLIIVSDGKTTFQHVKLQITYPLKMFPSCPLFTFLPDIFFVPLIVFYGAAGLGTWTYQSGLACVVWKRNVWAFLCKSWLFYQWKHLVIMFMVAYS